MKVQLLNENQKLALTVTLRLLEERLAEVERLITVEERGVLYERVASFTPPQGEAMRALIQELRDAIRQIADQFQLAHEIQDPARRINGLLSVTWESLEELDAKSMKAYGDVHPQLAEVLNPWEQKLTHLTLTLKHLAFEAPPPEASPRNDS